MGNEGRTFHFNVNNRTNSGSRAQMANNESAYMRAMEIQDRKREIEEKKRQEEERIRAAQAPVEEIAEPVVEEETEVIETAAEEAVAVPAEPETPKAAPAPKPSGGGVPGPIPRSDFTSEERALMLKRAKAHAAEVAARKNK